MVDPQTVASTCHYVGFCALKSADQAAWASAIGSFLAALVALGIALSGGVAKHLQRRRDGRALAAYIHTDLYTTYNSIEQAAARIELFLLTQDGISDPSDLAAYARDATAGMMAPVLESKVDQFGKLPSDIGEELAGAVGSLSICRAAVERFAYKIRQTEPARWESFCSEILSQLNLTLGNMKRAVDYCRQVGGDR
jgi:hypothetical protein